MPEEREFWIKLKSPGERSILESRAQNAVSSPDQRGDSQRPRISIVSFRPLAVILGFLVGWVALVLVLRVLLPVSNKEIEALRGGVYLAYMVLATIVIARSIRATSRQ